MRSLGSSKRSRASTGKEIQVLGLAVIVFATTVTPAIAVQQDHFGDPELDARYSAFCEAAGEPELPEDSEAAKAYRFLWLRSFHGAVLVRVWKRAHGFGLVARLFESPGGPGSDPHRIVETRERDLSEAQWERLQRLLRRADFWHADTQAELDEREIQERARSRAGSGRSEGRLILRADGAQWLLEGWEPPLHQAVDRWSPKKGAFRDVCLYLIELSGFPIADDEVY
jgi:hypothetical protein